MGLILCPECGSKISDRAVTCPNCGFQGADSARPISEQCKFEEVPVFRYEIAEEQSNDDLLPVISYEDNRKLVKYFGNWEIIQNQLPAIADVISAMAEKDHIMAAKMDGYVKHLIDKGVYRFVLDKNGEILPTIRDAEGFVKQVRLVDMQIAPNIGPALNDLTTQAAMAQILSEIEEVGNAIRNLHVELQNDRLAMAETAKDQLQQAMKIQDANLRQTAILNVINSATAAKRTLMRNFSQGLHQIVEYSNKSDLEMLLSHSETKEMNSKAVDAFQSLVAITSSVKMECEGYALLGEYDACKECLTEFKVFIEENKLEDRDTLLLINESTSQEHIDDVDKFSEIAVKISEFNPEGRLDVTMGGLLTNSNAKGEEKDGE